MTVAYDILPDSVITKEETEVLPDVLESDKLSDLQLGKYMVAVKTFRIDEPGDLGWQRKVSKMNVPSLVTMQTERSLLAVL